MEVKKRVNVAPPAFSRFAGKRPETLQDVWYITTKDGRQNGESEELVTEQDKRG